MEMTRRSFIASTAGAIAAGSLAASVAIAEEAAAPQADKVLEADVVVAGLGTSGLMASVGAAKQGARVIAVDRASMLAATTDIFTHGPFIVGSKLQLQYENPLTVEEAMTYLQERSNYAYNGQSLRTILEATGRAANILIDDGGFVFDNSPFPTSTPESEMINRAAHTYDGRGAERADMFQKMLDANSVETMFGTKAQSLIFDAEGAIAGIRCESEDEGIIDIYTKAVVLCTGGFLGNAEYQKKYFAGANVVSKAVAVGDGAGIDMALSAGAQIGKTFSIVMNEYGGANTKAFPITGSNSFASANPGNDFLRLAHLACMFVDANGARFTNEGYLAENPFYSGEPLTRQSTYYAIFDEAYMTRLETEPFANFFHTAKMVRGAGDKVLENAREQFAEAVEQEWGYKADTLEELAQALSLPMLPAAVEKYNAAAEAGFDDEFFTKPEYLIPVLQAPFYAIELQPSAYMSLGGIKCNGNCQALDERNVVINGLYVAGGDADIHTAPYLQNGSANGFALGSGLIAGEAAGASAMA
ncbi:MAG: FAD-binding protein [Coriobacteriales bacterium]|nr:FAD-binding protein [Coriobacteriales bacterium]